MQTSATDQKHALMRGIFGRKWWETAARILGCTEGHAFALANGRRTMQLRQWRVLETYANQKARTRSQRDARQMAALERQLRKEAQAEEEAARALGASLARLKREGKI